MFSQRHCHERMYTSIFGLKDPSDFVSTLGGIAALHSFQQLTFAVTAGSVQNFHLGAQFQVRRFSQARSHGKDLTHEVCLLGSSKTLRRWLAKGPAVSSSSTLQFPGTWNHRSSTNWFIAKYRSRQLNGLSTFANRKRSMSPKASMTSTVGMMLVCCGQNLAHLACRSL